MGDVGKSELDRALRERDVLFLSDQISNEDLTPEVRGHLARIIRSLLTGETTFPRHRPATTFSNKNIWKIALRALDRRRNGWGKLSAAVVQTSIEFSCSERKVWGCLKELRKVYREVEVYDLDSSWDEQRREERREEERREEERQEEERREEELWEELLEEERQHEGLAENKS